MEILQIDIPQLLVTYVPISSGIDKNHLRIGRDYFLWGYLREKQREYAVRHSNINELLRDIYLIHEKNKSIRQAEVFYQADKYHYNEIDTITTVSILLVNLVKELLSIIYFMSYLNSYKSFPTGSIEGKWEEIIKNPSIFQKLQPFNSFNQDVELIAKVSSTFSVYPYHDKLLLDDEPVIFIYECTSYDSGNLIKKNLKSFIQSYNDFFEASRIIIKENSLDTMSHDI